MPVSAAILKIFCIRLQYASANSPIAGANQELDAKAPVHVSAGSVHTAVATADGELFTFGDSTYGKLGVACRNGLVVPRKIRVGSLLI